MAISHLAPISSAVTIDDSILESNGIKTFTSNYCKNNQGSTILEIYDKNLNSVSKDAFQECKKLNFLSLSKNRITNLDEEIFKFNYELTRLELYCNYLTFLSPKHFEPLRKLQILSVDGNPLQTIQPLLDSKLNHLDLLAMNGMGLFESDINVDEITNKLPKLKHIRIDHNHLSCDAFEDLEKKFKAKGVTVPMNQSYHLDCTKGGYKICYQYAELYDIMASDVRNQSFKEELAAMYYQISFNDEKNKNLQSTNIWIVLTIGCIIFTLMVLVIYISVFVRTKNTKESQYMAEYYYTRNSIGH